MQKFTPEDAITWVDQNAKQIIGHSRKYLPFAPYDQEDFLQDAYEAALEATKVSTDRQVPFLPAFGFFSRPRYPQSLRTRAQNVMMVPLLLPGRLVTGLISPQNCLIERTVPTIQTPCSTSILTRSILLFANI